ncbi:MAG: right-handed parallel beta-helix repeat-containing protein, partial [Planctomycetota bacterium]
GIDFEPNRPENKLVNCVLRNCVLENNAGPGILVYPKPLSQDSDPILIRVENCLVRGGKGAGIEVGAVLDNGPEGTIEFDNCTIERTALAGIAVYDKSADRAQVRFVNCRCKDVGLKKDRAGTGKKDSAVPLRLTLRRPQLTKRHGGIDFLNCWVYDSADRPTLVLEDKGSGLGVHDLTGNITVCNPHGARVDYRCNTSKIKLRVTER